MRFIVCFIILNTFCAFGQVDQPINYFDEIFFHEDESFKRDTLFENLSECSNNIFLEYLEDRNYYISCLQKKLSLIDSLILLQPKNTILYYYKIKIISKLDSYNSYSTSIESDFDIIYQKFPTVSFINYAIFDSYLYKRGYFKNNPLNFCNKTKFHLQEAIKYNSDTNQISKLLLEEIYMEENYFDSLYDFHNRYNICQKALQYDSTNSEIHQKFAEIYEHFGCLEEAENHYKLFIYFKYQKYYRDYFKKNFNEYNLRINENGERKFGAISFNFELSHFFSENSKKLKQIQIFNPSFLFYKLNINDFRFRIHKEDSIYFNYTNIPYVYHPLNFEILDSLNTLMLIGNDSDFIPEIPRSLLNLKSLKKIVLHLYFPKSEIEFIKKNYPNIELVYDDLFVDEKSVIKERSYFYEKLNNAGIFKY